MKLTDITSSRGNRQTGAARSVRRTRTAKANLPLWGIFGMVLTLAIVFGFPLDRPLQVIVVATILSLSAAGIASAISGVVNLNTGILRAGGPFVVFVVVFLTFIAAGAPGVLPDLGFLLGRGSIRSTR